MTEEELVRFQTELEFVQCLANPFYLHHLALNREFDKPEVVAYIEYLQYWKQKDYAKYLIYPHALYFLELLQSEEFRKQVLLHLTHSYCLTNLLTMSIASNSSTGNSIN